MINRSGPTLIANFGPTLQRSVSVGGRGALAYRSASVRSGIVGVYEAFRRLSVSWSRTERVPVMAATPRAVARWVLPVPTCSR